MPHIANAGNGFNSDTMFHSSSGGEGTSGTSSPNPVPSAEVKVPANALTLACVTLSQSPEDVEVNSLQGVLPGGFEGEKVEGSASADALADPDNCKKERGDVCIDGNVASGNSPNSDGRISCHTAGAVKRKIKEESGNSHPNFLGIEAQRSGLEASLARPSPAKVQSRGKSDGSRPSLQDVISQLAHSAGGNTSTTPSPAAVALSPSATGTAVSCSSAHALAGSSLSSSGSSPSSISGKGCVKISPSSSEKIVVKSEVSAMYAGSPVDTGSKLSGSASVSPVESAYTFRGAPHQAATSVSPKTPPRGGKSRERKLKVDNLSSSSSTRHSVPPQASASAAAAAAIDAARIGIMQPRIPINGAIFPGMSMGYDKFGGFVYDYNLPDRGLGSGPIPGLPPRFPGVAPNMVGYFPLPVTAWNLASAGTIQGVSPGISADPPGVAVPLDLSATHKESSEKFKEKTSLAAATVNSSKNFAASSVKLQPVEEKEKGKAILKANSEPLPEVKPASEPTSRKPKYEKHMLIFADKEVEIICVEKNRWIVRNEQELYDILRSTSPQHDYSPKSKISHLTPCDSASGSDCECLRNSIGQDGECTGETRKHNFKSKDECACVSSSNKRAAFDTSSIPTSSTQKRSADSMPSDEVLQCKIRRHKITATSSTCHGADSGEDEMDHPTVSSPTAVSINSSDSPAGELKKAKASSVLEPIDLVCVDDDLSASRCPVLQQMLKTPQ